jgi:DNA replication and repair protein RecF
MQISKIQLFQFCSYEQALFEFKPGLNCIIGPNGSGKTNLLDAIYYLCYAKSVRHSQDQLSVRFEKDYLKLDGIFEADDNTEQITVTVPKMGKKILAQDHVPYPKLIDHIGKYTAVFFQPEDTDLIRDGAESRRKLFDGILSSFSKAYLQQLLKYNRCLDQRNTLLKAWAETQQVDLSLLDIYDQQLSLLGTFLHEQRAVFIRAFLPFFLEQYAFLSNGADEVSLSYLSDLTETRFEDLLKTHRNVDLQAQRSTKGIHKDDYFFLLGDKPIKKFGSQGQKKTFVLALKLAQIAFLKEKTNMTPIVLLDDIFDKLDESRIAKLVNLMQSGLFSQIFLTDARPQRAQEWLGDHKAHFIFTQASS